MFGKNPKRGIVKSENGALDVQEIFATIQGEGPNVGRPSIFVRLGGCNLACDFCDTEFEDFSQMSLDEIISEIDKLSGEMTGRRTHRLVVITGGEPFRQPIEKFVGELIARNYLVQIETNGTIFRKIHDDAEIICSPKASSGKFFPLNEGVLGSVKALKFIISKNKKPYDEIPDVGQERYKIPIYLQPMDEYDEEINQENMQFCRELAEATGNFISLQIHKILGVR